MKIRVLFFILLSSFLCYSLFSFDSFEQETRQIGLVSKIIKNSSLSKMNEVWPNYNLRSKPIFITFSNGHIYAFNIQLSETEWKKMNIEGMDVFHTNKDRWGITSAPMHFNFEINGQEAFVYRLDLMSGAPFFPFFILVHERFHVYQMKNFESERLNQENNYTESENIQNLSLMQLEELVLLDFMNALAFNAETEALVHLKTFLSINKKRQKILNSSSFMWEARQQMVEGLADYTAAKNLDVFGYFGEKMGQKHILQTMKSYTKEDDISERALKWRHYGVGASLGYALDFLKVVNWKKDVEQNIPLQILLEKNLKVSPEEIDFLFQQATEKYDYNKLCREIKEKIEAYNNMLNNHMDRFNNLPGIVVNIQTPPNSGLSAGGRSRGVYSLANGSMLSHEDTSKTSSADNCWMLELESMPYLFQTNDGFRRFKTSLEGLELIIDGQVYSPHHLNQKTFRQLVLKGKSCTFKSSRNPGRISLKNGELNITYQ